MSRAELIAELERLAQVFDGHPAHIGMHETLCQAIGTIHGLQFALDMVKARLASLTPSPPLNGQPPHAPDDT